MGIAPTASISHLIRQSVRPIRKAMYDAFEKAVIGKATEKVYLAQFAPALAKLFGSITVPGIAFSARHAVTHAKPKVSFPGGPCELADLLVVVKYHTPTGTAAARSILYQIKMSQKGRPTKYDIDQKQLKLLSTWPTFSFGLKADASRAQYSITPTTLEFGSYMLEPRDAVKGDIHTNKSRCYGVCPYATQVAAVGAHTVGMNSLKYNRGDVQNFFSHLAFEIGEPHTTAGVKNLIEALFRHVGLAPDPPDEFEGFYAEPPEDGFAVLEVNVKEDRGQQRPPPRPLPHPISQWNQLPVKPPMTERRSTNLHDGNHWHTGSQGTPQLA